MAICTSRLGSDLTRCKGGDVIAIGTSPRRAAGDGSRIKIVSRRNQQREGIVLHDEAMRALHDNEARKP